MGAGSSAQRRNVSPLGEKGTGGRKGSAGTGCWIRLCVSPSSSRAKVDTALCGARASGNALFLALLADCSCVPAFFEGMYACVRLWILCLRSVSGNCGSFSCSVYDPCHYLCVSATEELAI